MGFQMIYVENAKKISKQIVISQFTVMHLD